eukprot:9457751-Lingulodinium_polyedra.AAC.1
MHSAPAGTRTPNWSGPSPARYSCLFAARTAPSTSLMSASARAMDRSLPLGLRRAGGRCLTTARSKR